MQILIATRNRDKVKELKTILNKYGIQTISLEEWDPEHNLPTIEEIGNTLEENALIKARTAFSHTGLPSISDDTGLEVDALDGAPGIYSARFAGDGCSYEDNILKLLKMMKKIPKSQRKARFKTVACYVDETKELSCEGVVEGSITKLPRGRGGFGYDPIFYLPELDKTYAELDEEEKNKLSHRGKAMKNLVYCISEKFVSSIPSIPNISIISEFHEKGE